MKINRMIGIAVLGLAVISMTCAWRWNPADRVKVDAASVNVSTLQSSSTAHGSQIDAISGHVDLVQSAQTAISNRVNALNTNVWGTPGITPAANLTTNTVAIQAKSIAGGNLSAYRVLHVWLSTTDKGAATTNNIESLTLASGTAVATVTAKADYWYLTAAAGTCTATIVGTAVGTNYLMVADGSSIGSAAIAFVGP